MKCDVSVVGAGPSGSIAARQASKDFDTVLIGSGRMVQCAGLISVSGLGRLGVKPGGFVLNKVRGAKLYSPLGTEVVIDGGGIKAFVVDRLKFDEHLLEGAISAGAKYIPSSVDRINGALSTSSGETVNSSKIVLATGTNYTLQKKLRLDCPKDFLVGAQYELDVECDRDFVELHFVVPDFFAWVIPVDGYARVGLCTRRNAKRHLDDFVGRLKAAGRLKTESRRNELYGIVPIYDPSIRTQYDRFVTVGDAAGQVKASTGGGIVFGGIAAELACSVNYESEWRRKLGRELALHLMFHRFMSRLSQKSVDRFLQLIGRFHSNLEQTGDMDYAVKSIRSLLANPRFTIDFMLNAPFFLADMI